MRRMLSAWLPHWPTLRLRKGARLRHQRGDIAPEAPLATIESIRGQRRLADTCAHAAALGLYPGQVLAEARAICPTLEVAEADPPGDRAALAALAGWCERYTPLATLDPPDGLWLDITGCAHLMGGEQALADDLAHRLARQDLPVRIAVAATAGAAWALARSATGRASVTVLPPSQEKAALALLPVSLLRLEPRTVAGLRRLGLKTIGELARLPRGELSARFGPLPVLRLDQAFGAAADAIAWPRPPAPWQEQLAFAEPVSTPDGLGQALDRLAARLCQRLEAASRGGHRFAARFFRLDGTWAETAVGTALPVRDPARVAALLRAKLDQVDPGFGVEMIRLAAEETAPLRPPQRGLSTIQAAAEGGGLGAVVDDLANRLGADRLWRPAPQDSHVPERTVRPVPPMAAAPAWEADPAAERPVRMFRRPEPIEVTAPVPDDPPILFRWRGVAHRVRAASGPERIAAEWWRRRLPGAGPATARPESDLIRDYYRVEDEGGGRFWIFRAGLHAPGHPARWFLHGLFG
jgi:protein ImuB